MANSESPSQGRLIFRGILFIVLIITIIYKCSSSDGSTPSIPSRSDAVTQEDSRISFDLEDEKPDDMDLQVASQYFVKDKLLSPSSADFSTLDHNVNYIIKDKIYLVTGSVEAKNGFNVTIKRRYALGLQYLGGNPPVQRSWKLESFEWLD